jgi:hypothetical protein
MLQNTGSVEFHAGSFGINPAGREFISLCSSAIRIDIGKENPATKNEGNFLISHNLAGDTWILRLI